jgi:hypothetical protein
MHAKTMHAKTMHAKTMHAKTMHAKTMHAKTMHLPDRGAWDLYAWLERKRKRERERASEREREPSSVQRLDQKALDVLFPNFRTMYIFMIKPLGHIQNIRKRSRIARSSTNERNADW